jgi:hypothetical protein
LFKRKTKKGVKTGKKPVFKGKSCLNAKLKNRQKQAKNLFLKVNLV